MLKENKNRNIKIIAGLMLCSACLIPFIAKSHHIHADTEAPKTFKNTPEHVHKASLKHQQKVLLTLQQRIDKYQHDNNIKSQKLNKNQLPDFTPLHSQRKIDNNKPRIIKKINKNIIISNHSSQHNKPKAQRQSVRSVNRALGKTTPNFIPKKQVRMTRSVQPPMNTNNIAPYHDLSKNVLRYRPYLNKVCRQYHMRYYEVLMLAIMQTESHGNGKDVMQASASLGKKPNSLNPQQSIVQAVRYMRGLINQAQRMDRAEQQNKDIKPRNYHHYATDTGLLAQSYNFGSNFLNYVGHHNQGFNINISRDYSRNVIAPLLGNKKHKAYAYNNALAKFYGTPYLYKSGGNYLYGMIVDQYISDGTPMQDILHNLAQYNNTHYIYGGKKPSDGFDASGLIAYGYNKTYHIHMPKTIYQQWHYTRHVRSGINGAKPGDLIFFKGTFGNKNHLSHVEFVVNRHLMFGITSSGIGFHYINNPYWIHHYAGVRRIPQYYHINLQTERKLNRQARQYSQIKR